MHITIRSITRLSLLLSLLTIFTVTQASSASYTFNVEFDGTNYTYGPGPDPLTTDLIQGDDITYILSASPGDYWQTTRDFWHFAFLGITTTSSGWVSSTGTVSYSMNGTLIGTSDSTSLSQNDSGLAGSAFILDHPTQFDQITITSLVDETENPAPFRISNYQVTELDIDWVIYVVEIGGDVNLDGQVSLADTILILGSLVGRNNGDVWSAGDVNGDSRIALPEAIFTLEQLAIP